MSWQLSRLGNKLTGHSGILELMDDLGKALSGQHNLIMMGGGNPARIPRMEDFFRTRMKALMDDGTVFDAMLGNYDTPQGNSEFLKTMAAFLRRDYGWNVGPENITITNGSQNTFFYLFNMLAGGMPDGSFRKIVLPLVPEYIGYRDQGLCEGLFRSVLPVIHDLGHNRFKYGIDFNALKLTAADAAVCVSRPCNPTGNVLTNEEIHRLNDMCREAGIPLMVDSAYGMPFPQALYVETDFFWNENMVISMSLSKLGLPGTRTGIVVAHPELIKAIANVNAIAGLASGGIGQMMVKNSLENGEITRLCRDVVTPYYHDKSLAAQASIEKHFGSRFPWKLHVSEGAFFLWICFPGLPVKSQQLYQTLKEQGLLVIDGGYFFIEAPKEYAHQHECIRMTYTQDMKVVDEGIRLMADTVEKIWKK